MVPSGLFEDGKKNESEQFQGDESNITGGDIQATSKTAIITSQTVNVDRRYQKRHVFGGF